MKGYRTIWWRYAHPMVLRLVFAAVVLAGPLPSMSQVVSANGEWAALRFGSQCEARTKAVSANAPRPPGIAGFAFGAVRSQGQFYARLSRSPRAGSTAMLHVGEQPFLLEIRGQWAWARDARQNAAIMDAARYAGSMRVESRDSSGRRFADRYLLTHAATAIDAAAAACATAGKSR